MAEHWERVPFGMQHLFWRFWLIMPTDAWPENRPGIYIWVFGGPKRVLPLRAKP